MNIGDFVRLVDPPADAKTETLDNAWLKRIRAAVGDEVGVVTGVTTGTQTLIDIDFLTTYGGGFYGIPTSMVEVV